MADIRLTNVAKSYKSLPHQISALNWLQEQIAKQPEVMAQFAEMWRADPEPKPEASPSPGRISNPLSNFPYFSQNDNGEGSWRQCQTSSIAMCLKYLGVKSVQTDLDYLAVVNRHGDTTSQAAHAAALKELGIKARFRQNMTAGELQAEIKAGMPVAIGVLHHGPVSHPSGGGHYVVIYGFDTTKGVWNVMDPFGELDLVNGGWARQGGDSGRAQLYSMKNLSPRWLVEGPQSGWGWVFS